MLAIYHWGPIANGGKPVQAAFDKGVDFESHYVDVLAFDQHRPDYLNGKASRGIRAGNRTFALGTIAGDSA